MRCKTCGLAIAEGEEYICSHCGTSGTTNHNDDPVLYCERRTQIAKDFAPYHIYGKIKTDAIELYLIVMNGSTLKQGKRRAMMWKCAYYAFIVLNREPRDPILLARLFNVTLKQMRVAQADFAKRIHLLQLQDIYPTKFLNAEELLPEFMLYLNVDPSFGDTLLDLIGHVLAEYESAERIQPRIIAICAILWLDSVVTKKLRMIEVCKDMQVPKATANKTMQLFSTLL
ncbi:MAG: hypothetical protein ACMG6E_01890 [Candidatus Roizmanbacteria bacterium]